jgi:hydrogenase maturation protease
MIEREWVPSEGTDRVGRLHLNGHLVEPGDRVRLHPRPGGDVFDLALADQTARIESVQQDFEGKFHIVVLVDDDPGRAIGPRGPAHRFFFAPDEVELLPPREESAEPREPLSILVAGIGNIFLGDDGFGVEVAQRLARRQLPPGVRVTDFGIRGYDLAYALMGGHDRTILVDACPRGGAPGTVYVIETELEDAGEDDGQSMVDAHDMNPLHVLRLARSLGAAPKKLLVVGCEPATLGPDEGQIGLSPTVAGAVDEAVALIERLVVQMQSEHATPTHGAHAAPDQEVGREGKHESSR